MKHPTLFNHTTAKIGLCLMVVFCSINAYALQNQVEHASLQSITDNATNWGSTILRVVLMFSAFCGVIFLVNGIFSLRKSKSITEELIFVFISAILLIGIVQFIGWLMNVKILF